MMRMVAVGAVSCWGRWQRIVIGNDFVAVLTPALLLLLRGAIVVKSRATKIFVQCQCRRGLANGL